MRERTPERIPAKAIKHWKVRSPQAARSVTYKKSRAAKGKSAQTTAGAPSGVSKTMRILSTYIAGALKIPLPKEVAERAKLHLLDTLAAIISGSRLLPGKRVIDYIKTLGGTKEAGVLGTRIMTTAVNAALANGIFGHADETDDWHQGSITHPGCSVVPAVFALAERNQRSGSALLRATVLGYDVATRLAMSIDAFQSFLHGHHPPSFGGLFGSAAAAGALAGLDADRVRHMLSYTAQQASGITCLLRDPEHIEKAFDMGGMPAHNAVQAALLVAHGFTGVADVFSGDRNFFAVYSPGAKPELLSHELGETYEIMNASIKKWPVGGPILAPLDALEALMNNNVFSADDVKRVVVRMGKRDAVVGNDRAMPDVNLQYLIAVMLVDRAVSFKAAHDFKRMHDHRILKLKQRIELVGSAAMSTPQHRWHGEVEIILRGGRTIKHYAAGARGGHQNPLTREEGNAKAIDLLGPVLGKRRGTLLIDTVWNIEKIKDVRAMRSLYIA